MTTTNGPRTHHQPAVHDLVACVCAPSVALSSSDGQIRAHGAQGFYVADTRVLAQALLLLDGVEPTSLTKETTGAGQARFIAMAVGLGDGGVDPTVVVERQRRVTGDTMSERIWIESKAAEPVRTTVTIALLCQPTGLANIKYQPINPEPAYAESAPQPGHLTATAAASGESMAWRTQELTVTATGAGARVEADPGLLHWTVDLEPRQRTMLSWSVRVEQRGQVVMTPASAATWSQLEVVAADPRLGRLTRQSLDDLTSLRLAEPPSGEEVFLAAGVPWFLTLFGRDSLWAARMLLPLGTELAASTLRALARRQGQRLDPASGEAPGKIMHELRGNDTKYIDGNDLPAAYYGTVDATMLWISLLHDAWRWGMPEAEVACLMPNLRSALYWLAEYADPDGDGFVEYIDASGHGLANQGWKDSGDAVRFLDGRMARPPIALCEVQGYAHRAALDAAALLDAFGQPGADQLIDYAGSLRHRFRERFWADGPLGPYPVLALDGDKRQVDSLTSNIGHLVDSGLLDDEEVSQVARLLCASPLAGGYGLRTMSTLDAAYNPLSYHCGSIWPHDTAIAVLGLARAGEQVAASHLAAGLLAAAEAFDYQLPELYGGHDRSEVGRPVPYPGACHPQAWAAAAAIVLVQAIIGVWADVPGGTMSVTPLVAGPASVASFGPILVRGLRVGGERFELAIDAAGRVEALGLPSTVRIVPTPTVPRQNVVVREPRAMTESRATPELSDLQP